jgi:hypothetical protein
MLHTNGYEHPPKVWNLDELEMRAGWGSGVWGRSYVSRSNETLIKLVWTVDSGHRSPKIEETGPFLHACVSGGTQILKNSLAFASPNIGNSEGESRRRWRSEDRHFQTANHLKKSRRKEVNKQN